jgi:hypothetical protein
MSKFSWERYGQQHQPIEPAGFFAHLCGFMKALFRLTVVSARHG